MLLAAIGLFLAASGVVYYRSKNAGKLLKDALVFRVFPGAAFGIPLGGLACLGLAAGLATAQPLRSLIVWISLALALLAPTLFAWCPKALLPEWLKEQPETTSKC